MQQSSGQPDPAKLNVPVIPLGFAELELRFAGVADPEALMPQAVGTWLGLAWRARPCVACRGVHYWREIVRRVRPDRRVRIRVPV